MRMLRSDRQTMLIRSRVLSPITPTVLAGLRAAGGPHRRHPHEKQHRNFQLRILVGRVIIGSRTAAGL